MCAILYIVRMYLLKLVRFSVSTAFPVWVLFVNVLLDCVFAWFYTDRLGFFFECCIFTFEKINTSFVELSLIHFS